jgi:chromate transporter
LWKLGHTAIKSVWLAIVSLVILFLAVVGVSPLLVLIVGGFLGIVLALGPTRMRTALITFLQATSSMPGAVAALPASPGLLPIFLIFVKIGSIVFGSGYVLLVFLHADLVERHAWLTQQQLLDAVAVGQVTPGPVFTTATFLGYLLRGTPGAIVATTGIFLPAFVLVALSAPLIPKIRASRLAGAALDGINVASLALMALVTWQLARSALVDWITIALAVVSALLLFRLPRLNSAWLIVGAGLIGVVRYVVS